MESSTPRPKIHWLPSCDSTRSSKASLEHTPRKLKIETKQGPCNQFLEDVGLIAMFGFYLRCHWSISILGCLDVFSGCSIQGGSTNFKCHQFRLCNDLVFINHLKVSSNLGGWIIKGIIITPAMTSIMDHPWTLGSTVIHMTLCLKLGSPQISWFNLNFPIGHVFFWGVCITLF